MLNMSCYEFIGALATKAPVPGGGGASALMGAIGVALGSMVGNLTVGKKKYADIEEEIQDLLKKSDMLTKRLNGLVLADAEVFEPLSRAYGLPADTEEEKAAKDEFLQTALVKATQVPLEIAECCLEGIRLLADYAKKGSRLAVSDAGVGAIFCKSALQGAKLNVLINLKLMKNEALKKEFSRKMAAIEDEGLKLADQIYEYVEEYLSC
jgi:formiminotetrahydrofolate cyclodeaminase